MRSESKRFIAVYFKALMSAVLLAAVIAAASCGKAYPDVGESWTVGFGESEIFLDLSDDSGGEYYIAGFRNGNKATGILDSQTVRALWLDDNTGRGGVLFITVDCVGLSDTDCEAIRDAVRPVVSSGGRKLRDVFVISTHDHAGVDTLGMWGEIGICGKNPRFMQELTISAVTAASNAVIEPYADIGEAELTYKKTLASCFRDSRPPELTDSYVHRIAINREGLGNISVFNVGIHAESLGGDNSLVSADFPGALYRMYPAYGDLTVFVPGTLGGLIAPKEGYDSAWKAIADAGYADIIGDPVGLAPSIELASADITIPLDNPIFAVLKTLGVINHKTVRCDSETGLGIRTRVSWLRLGGRLDIMLVPGELTPELGYSLDTDITALETLIPDGNDLLIFSLADDEIGYILPEKDFMVDRDLPYLTEYIDDTGEKHYEETNSPGPKTYEVIFEAFRKLSEKLDKH